MARRTLSAAVEAAAERSEKSSRLVSISEFERLTGFDRGTVRNWIKKHRCPVENAGGKGEAVLLDIRAVWKWREEFVRAEEAAKYARADASEDYSGVDLTPADRLKLAQIRLTNIKIAREAEMLLPREFVEFAVERMFGVVRQTVMAVPERIFRKMGGFPEDRKLRWYGEAQKQCTAALSAGAKAIGTVLEDMEDRLASGLPPTDDLPEIEIEIDDADIDE